MAEREPPPVTFDGRWYWFTSWFDPSDDRCSRCRGPIGEDEVPLILFKDVGTETWQARFCEECTVVVLQRIVARARRG